MSPAVRFSPFRRRQIYQGGEGETPGAAEKFKIGRGDEKEEVRFQGSGKFKSESQEGRQGKSYENLAKASIIEARTLIHSTLPRTRFGRRVAHSASPGKTKHLQTLLVRRPDAHAPAPAFAAPAPATAGKDVGGLSSGASEFGSGGSGGSGGGGGGSSSSGGGGAGSGGVCMVCDCPGLVPPTASASRATLVSSDGARTEPKGVQ
jgi:uncharacterized membrane protein YgcG